MTTHAGPLGKEINIVPIAVPADAVAGAITGNRVHMKDYEWCTFVLIKTTDAGTTDDIAVDLQEHNAASGGTSQDLDIITDYYYQQETTLDGDETWSKTTQTAASEISAIAGTAETQFLLAVSVHHSQLSDSFEWLSLNVPDLGSTDVQYVAIIAVLTGLKYQEAPESLPAAN